MESHNEFAGHVEGVFHEMVYDNMKVAIAEFVRRNEKQPNKVLTCLSRSFQFRWHFNNLGRVNENLFRFIGLQFITFFILQFLTSNK